MVTDKPAAIRKSSTPYASPAKTMLRKFAITRERYFSYGSLTIGTVTNSMLTSLPLRFSVRRR